MDLNQIREMKNLIRKEKEANNMGGKYAEAIKYEIAWFKKAVR